jgi:hypothetical protein
MEVTQKLIRLCAVIATMMSITLFAACTEGDDANTPANAAATSSPQTANTAGSANKSPSGYYGAVDYRDCNEVKGWVWNGADPNAAIRVELYVDGKLADTQPARNPRPDLKSSNLGTGNYGFAIKIPASYKDGNQHTVSAKVAGSDYTLPVSQGVYAAVACKP